MKIYIPNLNDISYDTQIINSQSGKEKQDKIMININTATVEDLQKLNGIGEAMAIKIVSYRKENGKFGSIEELKNISGIGDSKYEKIKDNIYV